MSEKEKAEQEALRRRMEEQPSPFVEALTSVPEMCFRCSPWRKCSAHKEAA